MPPSDSTGLADLARRLDGADPDERAAIAIQIQEVLLDDVNTWGNLPPALLTQSLAMLGDDDPTVRSVGAVIASHVGVYGERYYADQNITDRAEFAAAAFDALDDESPVVRQAAADTHRLGDIIEEALDDTEFRPLPSEHIAATLVERLHDPDPAVRRRIGKIFFEHGAALLGAHPDPGTAVESLVETFGDPVNGYCTYTRPVASARHAALMTLEQGFDEYDAVLLAGHGTAIAARLHDERRRVRTWAARLLDTLVSAGVVPVGDIADDVITAAQRDDPRAMGRRFPRLALRVALVEQDAVGPVYEHLRQRFTVTNTRTDRWRSDDPYLIGLSRLVRVADHSFDPPGETLAAVIAQDTAATDGNDPLALLAPDHPEFVADQLRQGYRLLVEGELDYSSRFYRNLVVDVADRNPAAIEGVPEILAENLLRSDVRKTMSALVDAHPNLGAHVVPDAYARAEWEPPLRYQHSQLIEETAEHWETVPDGLTETLVETVGTNRSEKRRRFAIRALVALDEEGLSVLPERFSPFVDLYNQGAFDDDGDPVDPLETDAAESAGLR
ncbi:hypothetical protein NDI56_11200 [Haloarcula sp. S1CR25-12]|uniref:HEAT repeat domain-containing protein n=1 Tax=Haloarcula saliterrae TaxID=2950534 RepID=A0ABU2FCJ7_9EURY|nr:hypothetical protein [Haloarcula sp. S1CR25-12]MDS0259961.1 hypothetical protein [Haloarcula sp. S1CR25-12]